MAQIMCAHMNKWIKNKKNIELVYFRILSLYRLLYLWEILVKSPMDVEWLYILL
jgi:hypothetical protein